MAAKSKEVQRLLTIRNHLRAAVGPAPASAVNNSKVLVGREFEIKTPWGYLRGKEWGTPNKEHGIVALHGLLDNCATYDRLAPLLPAEWHFVAYDFPGYGLSTPYPCGGYQTRESYLVDFTRVLQHFGWKTQTVVGHSLGGAVTMCLGGALPHVTRVILLDPAKPLSSVGARQPDYLANFASLILQLDDPQEAPKPRLRTFEDAVQVIVKKSRGSLSESSARLLASRAVSLVDPAKKLYSFNTDPKNLLGVQPMFEEVGMMAFATYQGKNCDTLVITTPEWAIPDWAIGLDSVSREEYFKECFRYNRTQHVQVDGTHHVHLNEPHKVSGFITEFIKNSKVNLSQPHITVISH